MAERRPAIIGIVCVGTELLRGQLNTHQSWLSSKLQDAGLFAGEEATLPDERRLIALTLRRFMRECDGIIVCGGLGPTFDDVTREAAADALGARLSYRPRLFEDIRRKLVRHAMTVPEENKRQAFVLSGARVLDNAMGSAPGQIVPYKRKGGGPGLMVLLPGPGSEMQPMFERQVLPVLRRAFARGLICRHWAARLIGVSESAADEKLAPVTAMAGPGLDFTILSSAGQVDYHATVSGPSRASVERTLAQVRRRVFAAVGEHVFGEDDDTLESVCGERLRRAGLTLAVAESCTAGLLGARITRVAGSSEYFKGGVIAYSNEVKRRVLGVRAATLARHGAVSPECVGEMARGVRQACRADVGLAVTGIAGPGGGSKQKPVGLVYVAASAGRKTLVRGLRLAGGREAIRARAAAHALGLVLRLPQSRRKAQI